MKEILNSVTDTIKNRLTNSLYGTFFVSWLIFHWEFVYTLFFVDENIIWNSKMLFKNDYLIQEFFNIRDLYFWVSWILPFFLTWFIVWRLPKLVLIKAYNKTEEYEVEKKIINIVHKRRIIQEEAKLQEQNTKKIEAIAKQATQEKKIKETNPSINWEVDYLKFKKLNFAYKFSKIIESYYKKSGDITEFDQYGHNIIWKLPEDILAYAHSNELVTIDTKSNKIDFTQKGKFFVNRFLEDPEKPQEYDF